MLILEKLIVYENADFIRVIEFIRSSRDIRVPAIQRACKLGHRKTVRFIEILTGAGLIEDPHKYRMVMGPDGKRHRRYLPMKLLATDKELRYCILILERTMDEKNFENTFNYKVCADGSITITAYTGSGNTAVVPASISGHPVTKIAHCAFIYRDNLTKITIPDSVLEIEMEAFQGCINLKSITLPSRLTRIETGLFKGCKALTDVAIPEGVASIGLNAFAACRNLSSTTLPTALTDLGWNSFVSCTSLADIIIPHKVERIGMGAFSGCKNLKSITVQNRDTVIGENAFSGCEQLTVYAPSQSNAQGVAAKNGLKFHAL